GVDGHALCNSGRVQSPEGSCIAGIESSPAQSSSPALTEAGPQSSLASTFEIRMTKLQNWLLVCFAGALTLGALWGGSGLTRIAYTALEKWGNSAPDATPTLTKLNATLDFVNRPCASVDASGHLLPDGPICELDEAIHDIRKITTASGKQVKQTGALVTAVASNLDTVGESVKQVAGRLTVTADAATGALGEAQGTIAAGKPLLASLTRNSDDLNVMLKENAPSLHLTLTSAADFTANASSITLDLRKVADKETADYLKPTK